MNYKDFDIDSMSFNSLGDFIKKMPDALMNNLSEDEKQKVNNIVSSVDKTDLGAMEGLIKDLNKQKDASRSKGS